jgi:diguanylate cyclase (GGDEF) domain
MNGELNAVRASNQIDRHLYTGVDAIELTAYTLDNMIRDERPQKDIQDYLEDQSFATAVVVSEQSNGIYGYINGEYMDGVRWVPDEDYIPTERPWYIEARARSGKVAVIDPYLDAQTGSMIITFAKTLCDAKSVVAIDVAMEQLQRLTEDIAAHGNSDMEIVLDRSYQVISHSDKSEVGKDYSRDDGSFGSTLVSQLRSMGSDENHFSLHYDNAEYIVYAMAIENNWICISVTNATEAFASLRLPLILTIFAAVLIIGIQLLLMVRSIRKETLAERMRQLAAQQTEYAYFDQMTGLRNRRAYAEMVERLSERLPEDCCVVVFDVNGLKRMNDSCGHEAGDELIIAAAECIRNVFHDVESVFRTGGDEFCVITIDKEESLLQRLKSLERAAGEWKGRFVNGFSVSYGAGVYRVNAEIDALIKEADQKMYDYKSRYYSQTCTDRRRSETANNEIYQGTRQHR